MVRGVHAGGVVRGCTVRYECGERVCGCGELPNASMQSLGNYKFNVMSLLATQHNNRSA